MGILADWAWATPDPDSALAAIEECLRRERDPAAILDRWEAVPGLGLFLARVGAALGGGAVWRVFRGQGETPQELRLARLLKDAEGILGGVSHLGADPIVPTTPEEAWAMALDKGLALIAEAGRLVCAQAAEAGKVAVAVGSLARGELVPGEPPRLVCLSPLKGRLEWPWFTVALPPESLQGGAAVTTDPAAEVPWPGQDWWALVWACHAPIHGELLVPRPEWSPRLLARLIQTKALIEAERSPKHFERRRVNLDDVSWAVDLAVLAGVIRREPVDTPSRIRSLRDVGVLSPLESEAMADAHAFLLETRLRLGCLGFSPETVPENPDKLSRVAGSFGMNDGNSFLGSFEGFHAVARRLFVQVAERLRS
jgi:hypothetical protein